MNTLFILSTLQRKNKRARQTKTRLCWMSSQRQSLAGGFETFPKRWYNFIVLTRRNGLSHAGGLETCSRSLCRLLLPFVEIAWHPLVRVASNALGGTKPFQEKKEKQGKP